jgi:hypothetical protein
MQTSVKGLLFALVPQYKDVLQKNAMWATNGVLKGEMEMKFILKKIMQKETVIWFEILIELSWNGTNWIEGKMMLIRKKSWFFRLCWLLTTTLLGFGFIHWSLSILIWDPYTSVLNVVIILGYLALDNIGL